MLKRVLMAVALGGILASATIARADAGGDAKKAVENFFTAVGAADEKAVKAAVVSSPEQNAAVDAYLDLMVATTKLQKAAVAKFGKAAAETFGATAGPQLEARLKAVEDATAKVAGDSVLLTVAADEAKKIPPLTIVVKKTTDGWKIDGGSLFNLSPENREQATQRAELSKKLTVITRQMTQEVNDGKYAAAVDAFQEFWTRSVKAAKTNPQAATTAPSTNK